MTDRELVERLAEVTGRIAAAAGGRAVDIVAVTKGFDAATVRAARDAGCVLVGENYAAELVAKAEELQHDPASSGEEAPNVHWHYLGAVQRRKVRDLAPHVALWQGVARLEEGREIALRAPGAAVLVQVNLAGDAGRNGCTWEAAPPLLDDLRALDLDVRGLMGVAGPDDPRRQFRRLAALAAEAGLGTVSMGMSGDFTMAVEEGASMVRLGTALFGPRPGSPEARR